MRLERLTESKSTPLELSEAEAEALNAAGERLASDRSWWGEDESDEQPPRSVIRCRPKGPGRYAVRVSDAVGVIAVGDLTLHVEPKIPVSHFIYIISRSDYYPRLDEQEALLLAGDDFFETMCRWYVQAAEDLLRRGLMKGYSAQQDFLGAKRGRIRPHTTAQSIYRGRIGFDCSFDEFNRDTPLNRVIRAATRLVQSHQDAPQELRRRARALTTRMDEVGDLRLRDLRMQVARRTQHYADVLLLGKQLLRAEGRLLGRGVERAWSFLIRTPELIEDGLRNLIREGLPRSVKVEKRQKKLSPSKVTFNPDLVIDDGEVVADVKYSLVGSDWSRTHLNQIITFSTVFGAERGLVLAFSERGENPPPVSIENVGIRCIPWEATGAASSMAEKFVRKVIEALHPAVRDRVSTPAG